MGWILICNKLLSWCRQTTVPFIGLLSSFFWLTKNKIRSITQSPISFFALKLLTDVAVSFNYQLIPVSSVIDTACPQKFKGHMISALHNYKRSTGQKTRSGDGSCRSLIWWLGNKETKKCPTRCRLRTLSCWCLLVSFSQAVMYLCLMYVLTLIVK